MKNSRLKRLAALNLVLGVLGALTVSGCKQVIVPVARVNFEPSDDHRSVRLSMFFDKNVHSNLSGNFLMADYGFLSVGPYTASEPFEVGFVLDLNVFDDPNYAKLDQRHALPNGLPLPFNGTVAEVKDPSPLSPQFTFYGYVDTTQKTWLGMAVMLNPPDDQYFPEGLAFSQGFLRDTTGKPGVVTNVFGPVTNSHGTVIRAGGISVFANIKQLLP